MNIFDCLLYLNSISFEIIFKQSQSLRKQWQLNQITITRCKEQIAEYKPKYQKEMMMHTI